MKLHMKHIYCVILNVFSIIVNFEREYCHTVSAHYEVTPAAGLVGLSCLTQHVEYNRAVRLHNTSGICEMLDADWNSSPVYESGFIYMKMLAYHNLFTGKFIIYENIPADFDVGNRFDVSFIITDAFPPKQFNIRVVDNRINTTFVQVSFRPYDNDTHIWTGVNAVPAGEMYAPLPQFTANTAYTVTVYFRSTHWEIYVDGAPFINFTHVYTFSSDGKQKVRFWSQDVLCRSVVFHVP